MFMSTAAGLNVLDTSAVQDRAAPGTTMHQLLPSRGYKHWHDGSDQPTQHLRQLRRGATPVQRRRVRLRRRQTVRRLRFRRLEAAHHRQTRHQPAAEPGPMGCQCLQQRSLRLRIPLLQRGPPARPAGVGVRVGAIRGSGCSTCAIRDNIREIAYFNPPAQTGKNDQLPNSQHVRFGGIVVPPASSAIAMAHAILNGQINGDDIVRDGRIIGLDLSADWCMSPPEFRGDLLLRDVLGQRLHDTAPRPVGVPATMTVRRALRALAMAVVAAVAGAVLCAAVIDRDHPRPPVLSALEIGFAQDMTAHHQQAVTMTDMLTADASPQVAALAEQIRFTQLVEDRTDDRLASTRRRRTVVHPADGLDDGPRHRSPRARDGHARYGHTRRSHPPAAQHGPRQREPIPGIDDPPPPGRNHHGGLRISAQRQRRRTLAASIMVTEQTEEIQLMTLMLDGPG